MDIGEMIKQFFRREPLLGYGLLAIVLGILLRGPFLIIIGIVLIIMNVQKKKAGGQRTDVLSLLKNLFNSANNTINNTEKPMETIRTKKSRHLGGWIGLGILVLIFLIFINAFWVIVDAGETGVQSLFGKVRDTELHSGFHIKNPFVKITKMDIRTQDYTMSITQGEGQKYGSDVITALTKEGLSVDLDITVLYHVIEEKGSDIYRDVGLNYSEIIIRPQVRSVIREVIAEYDAKDIYSEKRQEAALQIFEKLNTKLGPRGIEMEDVLLRHVELPADLAQSIQQKLQSEQEAQRYDFVLEKEQKEAERKRIAAEGQRDAQQIINQSLTSNYLNYLYIQSLENREGTIYVPTNPSTGVPLFRGL